MAKKKTTKPTKSPKVPKTTATHAARKATAKPLGTAVERVLETDNAPTVEEGPTPARQAGTLTDVEIGHVAGEVWGALSRNGPLAIAALKKEVDAPGDTVIAAIGWLAREDKLDFTTTGRNVKISLR